MRALASIPSPTHSVWHLGPLPVRAYALCIVAGIFVAVALTLRRWRERGGRDDDVWDIAGWAIVFGILGGRLYHVITDSQLYFGKGKHPLDALKIWDGGLGIWGSIALGAVGAWIGCRRKDASLLTFADAAVPGVALAQGLGRWGNWFNNELYGGPTSLPWGLQVHCMDITEGRATAFGSADGGQVCNGSARVPGLFQPTFLYESLWVIGLAVVLILIDRRLRLGHGALFALYAMGYTIGRAWIEALRTDPSHHILGLRLNDWTALVVFVVALIFFIRQGGFHAPREASPYRHGAGADSTGADDPSPDATAGAGVSVDERADG